MEVTQRELLAKRLLKKGFRQQGSSIFTRTVKRVLFGVQLNPLYRIVVTVRGRFDSVLRTNCPGQADKYIDMCLKFANGGNSPFGAN